MRRNVENQLVAVSVWQNEEQNYNETKKKTKQSNACFLLLLCIRKKASIEFSMWTAWQIMQKRNHHSLTESNVSDRSSKSVEVRKNVRRKERKRMALSTIFYSNGKNYRRKQLLDRVDLQNPYHAVDSMALQHWLKMSWIASLSFQISSFSRVFLERTSTSGSTNQSDHYSENSLSLSLAH